jgi:hypothetical protein
VNDNSSGFGCLSLLAIAAWTLVGVAVMLVILGGMQIVLGNTPPNSPLLFLVFVAPLAGLGVAFAGAVATVRRLRPSRHPVTPGARLAALVDAQLDPDERTAATLEHVGVPPSGVAAAVGLVVGLLLLPLGGDGGDLTPANDVLIVTDHRLIHFAGGWVKAPSFKQAYALREVEMVEIGGLVNKTDGLLRLRAGGRELAFRFGRSAWDDAQAVATAIGAKPPDQALWS